MSSHDVNVRVMLDLWFRAYEPPPEFVIEDWELTPHTSLWLEATLTVKIKPISQAKLITWKRLQNDLFKLVYEVYVHSGVLIWRVYMEDERGDTWGNFTSSPSHPRYS